MLHYSKWYNNYKRTRNRRDGVILALFTNDATEIRRFPTIVWTVYTPCTRVSHSNTGFVETGESDRNPFHGSGLRTFQPGKTVDPTKKIFKRNVYKYIIDTQLGEYRF